LVFRPLTLRAFFRLNPECRSELARDGLKSGAFIQKTRVIVNVHREQARSYKGFLARFNIVLSEKHCSIIDLFV
jgi:hypothetical protein